MVTGLWKSDGCFISDLAFFDHDNDPSLGSAALGNSSHSRMSNTFLDYDKYGLYVSKDGGTNWNQITTGLVIKFKEKELTILMFKLYLIVFG